MWYCVSKRGTFNFLLPSSAELFCILVQTLAFASCYNWQIQLSEEKQDSKSGSQSFGYPPHESILCIYVRQCTM